MSKRTALLSAILIFGMLYAGRAQQKHRSHENHKPPAVDEIFAHMDGNEDDRLSPEEVRGPLKEIFNKVDTDQDGYLSREEVSAAPKPKGRRAVEKN